MGIMLNSISDLSMTSNYSGSNINIDLLDIIVGICILGPQKSENFGLVVVLSPRFSAHEVIELWALNMFK